MSEPTETPIEKSPPTEQSTSIEKSPPTEQSTPKETTEVTTNEKKIVDTEKETIETEKKPFGDKDNIIFVGIKPFMNYVTGVVIQFQNKKQDEVIVSARGKFVSKAVDIVEVARRTFLKDENIQVKDIKISSEEFENKEGRRIFVSAIEITLTKE